jgi:choline dehydrogenase-like flavoprotein
MSEQAYDYVIVGGGTAGAVLAARLSEDPDCRVCVIEGGPSDVGDRRVLELRNWINLLGSELDYDYPTVEQPHGNSFIRHSRARVLGGCSSHNTLISFAPLPGDLDAWAAAGCAGWDAATVLPYFDRLQNNIVPVAEKDRNPIARDFVTAATAALGVPEVADFNAEPFSDGAGFFSVSYEPETGFRSSSSVAYLHPIMDRPNLELMLETWVGQIIFDAGPRARGVRVRRPDGTLGEVHAEREVLVCAGAVDSPRLLMLSGVGPADDLRGLGIDVVADLPGVGENLIDHPESVIIWETAGPIPQNSVMDSDAGLFVRRDVADPRPDLMFHFYQVPFSWNTERLGYPAIEHGVCMTPNIPRSRSRGRLWLRSADPAEKPALDFRYFTDPDGYDAQTIVDGLRVARDVAAQEPLKSWLVREVAPGPEVTSEEALSEYGRRVAHTVYHPLGTCKMGAADDPAAVVGPDLRVRGIEGLRVVDGSIFPSLTTVNPMVTILMIGERAADLVRG